MPSPTGPLLQGPTGCKQTAGPMLKLLETMLSRVIRSGDITVVDPAGRARRFGDATGVPITVRLADRRLERWLCLDPELAAGEAYMQGRLTIEKGDIYDLLATMMRNMAEHPLPAWSRGLTRARRLLRYVQPFNPRRRARANARRHYDIDTRLYELFLDPDRQYSCAYFSGAADLTAAQLAKKRHIAAKLLLSPGQHVLDIGSGWGGLALYLAREAGVDVTGITLSQEQLKAARERARAARRQDQVHFSLADYRDVDGPYDRIVSVGMFEHVGLPHYATYFEKIARLMRPDGVALVHTIGRTDGPAPTNPFIARHIFPGGCLPALSEMMRAIEHSGLVVCDVEVLRLHYAETLKAWRTRFLANRVRAVEIAGEEFCRMWESYLAGCEAAFRYQNLVVFQLQLARRLDALPTTRDYMLQAEHRLALRDGGLTRHRPRLAGE